MERVGAMSVYNAGEADSKTAVDPEVLVRTTLSDILSAMQGNKSIFSQVILLHKGSIFKGHLSISNGNHTYFHEANVEVLLSSCVMSCPGSLKILDN